MTIEEMFEEKYVFQGRIAICAPERIEMGEHGEAQRYRFDGVMLCPDGQPPLSQTGEWENIQCEIIIKPLKRLGTAVTMKASRLDQAMQMLSEDGAWSGKLDGPSDDLDE